MQRCFIIIQQIFEVTCYKNKHWQDRYVWCCIHFYCLLNLFVIFQKLDAQQCIDTMFKVYNEQLKFFTEEKTGTVTSGHNGSLSILTNVLLLYTTFIVPHDEIVVLQ